jgi:endonuclease/exonuclease/phosphatase family metal-dependent hydrolase
MLRTVLIFSLLCSWPAAWASDDIVGRIWRGSFAPTERQELRSVKLLSWNIERGTRFSTMRESVERTAAELLLLQEVDLNARRSGGHNIAEDLARSLGLNYIFAAEFEELSQSTGRSPAYHGQAILTSLPMQASRIVRFQPTTSGQG